jgi:hypothetical protein
VAVIDRWSAEEQISGRYRLALPDAERDPVYWPGRDPERLVAELELATTSFRGRAAVVTEEPLVIDVWRDDGE